MNDQAEVMVDLHVEGKTIDIPMIGTFKRYTPFPLVAHYRSGDSTRISQFIPIQTDYFKTRTSIPRATFAQMFSMKRTTAYLFLKELEQIGMIQALGREKETKYVKKVIIWEKDHGYLK